MVIGYDKIDCLQKMNILEPSFRLEQFPPEIDVYRVPHDRMKQLVSTISEKLPEIQVYSFYCHVASQTLRLYIFLILGIYKL